MHPQCRLQDTERDADRTRRALPAAESIICPHWCSISVLREAVLTNSKRERLAIQEGSARDRSISGKADLPDFKRKDKPMRLRLIVLGQGYDTAGMILLVLPFEASLIKNKQDCESCVPVWIIFGIFDKLG